MNQKANSPRDGWSKLEIITKLVGDIILVVIAVLIGIGSERIATALQSGELTQQLLTDLARADSASVLRHEIALAALDQSVYEQSPELVWEVCERILRNIDYKAADRTYAFHILSKRDSLRALSVYRDITLSNPDPAKIDLAQSNQQRDITLQQIVNDNLGKTTLGKVVFLQFKGDIHRDIIRQLQSNISKAGYTAPGIEYVAGNYTSEVRYFHPVDSTYARSVQELTQEFMNGTNFRVNVGIRDLTRAQFNAPEGQIEVWIAMD